MREVFRELVLLSCFLLPVACNTPEAVVASKPILRVESALSDARWSRYRSVKHGISLSLPDGVAWRIDSQKTSWIDAWHPRSRSRLRATTWLDTKPVSFDLCLDEVDRRAGGVSRPDRRSVIDERSGTDLFSTGFLSRVVVGVSEVDSEGIDGYAMAVGVSGRRCIVVIFTTRTVGTGGAEMGERLEIGARIIDSTKFESSMPGSGPLVPASVSVGR